MRVLLTYPGPTYSTYDVARGYERALRALGVEVHGYNYHQYLHFYSESLSHWETVNRDYERRLEDAPFYASQHLVPAVIDFMPHVVLVVSGSALHKRAYDLLRRLSVPVVLLLTESPYWDELQTKIITQGCAAAAFTNERESVERLSETGVPTTYLPHSYDPTVHRPRLHDVYYKTDVFFHGTLWSEREALLSAVKTLPYDVRCGGKRVFHPDEQRARTEEEHSILNDEMAQWYSNTQIAFNHHRSPNGDRAYSLGPRAYEIAACGAFQLCDGTRAELAEVFGDSVPTYTDADDLREKVIHYMARPDERRRLAEEARERVTPCTFEDRAREIVLPLLEEVASGR